MITSEILPQIREICRSPCGQRSSADIKFLMTVTKEIKLFKDLIERQGEYYHSLSCQYLLYEHINAQEYIFKQGDIGNKYYILLSGQVTIEITVSESGHHTRTEIMTYTPGSSFGELALDSSKPRSASAFCKTPSHLLALTKTDYSRLMQRIVIDKKNEMTDFLQSLPAFQKVNRPALSKLTYNITENSFTKGQCLFREGDQAREIMIVFRGECKLSKAINKQPRGIGMRKAFRNTVHTAKRMGRGAMIGEEDIIKKIPHSYSCVCSSNDVVVYCIPASDFFIRITGEQPLKYLRQVSEEKCKFLETWTNVRSSLDLIFDNRTMQKVPVEDSVMNLNSSFVQKKNIIENDSERFNDFHKKNLNSSFVHKKLIIENDSKSFNDLYKKKSLKPEDKSIRDRSMSRKHLAMDSTISFTQIPSIQTLPINSSSMNKIKHRKFNTFFEFKKYLPAR